MLEGGSDWMPVSPCSCLRRTSSTRVTMLLLSTVLKYGPALACTRSMHWAHSCSESTARHALVRGALPAEAHRKPIGRTRRTGLKAEALRVLQPLHGRAELVAVGRRAEKDDQVAELRLRHQLTVRLATRHLRGGVGFRPSSVGHHPSTEQGGSGPTAKGGLTSR